MNNELDAALDMVGVALIGEQKVMHRAKLEELHVLLLTLHRRLFGAGGVRQVSIGGNCVQSVIITGEENKHE